jgi:hypothetical protein
VESGGTLRLRSRRGTLAIGLIVLALVAVLGQVIYVRSETGRWAVTVSLAKAPSRIHFQGRAYEKGDQVTVPRNAVEKGPTAGGGVRFKEAGDEDVLSVGVYVSDGKNAWAYGLVGGP